MTRTQHLMVWALRALALWAAVELALIGYDEATREAAVWAAIQTQPATLRRLDERTSELRRALAPLEVQLAAETPAPVPLRPKGYPDAEHAIRTVMLQEIERYGGQSAEATVAVAPLGRAPRHAAIHLAWTESADTAPGVLAALAIRRPFLRLAHVAYARNDAGAVQAEADLGFNFVIQESTR